MSECTNIMLCEGDVPIVELVAYDQHGNGRGNKLWVGHVNGEKIELPNLAAVHSFAAKRGWTVDKL